MKPPTSEDITRQLQQAHFSQKHGRDLAAPPVGDTPMVVSLEQLRPYELNPRVVRNPLYDDIKASIRERGLDQPPAITRRPDESHFIIRNGGNTRLSILGELWQETREERFFRIHCLFRPWQSESHALLGHLAESDLHGQLTFIERALAVAKLQDMFQQGDAHLTQRELATRLSEGGYPISQSHISRMFDALEHLLPVIPQVLYAGLGKPAIGRLISLRRRAESIWNQYFGSPEQFPLLWFEVLSAFDSEKPELDSSELQDELIAKMAVSLEQTPRLLALELHQVQHPSLPSTDGTPALPTNPAGEPHVPSPTPDHPPETSTAGPNPEPDQTDGDTLPRPALRLPEIRQALGDEPLLEKPLEQFEEAPSTVGAAPSPPASLGNISTLRTSCATLAAELAAYADAGAMVSPHADGLGFTLSPGHSERLSPRHTGIQLLLSALLRLQDDVTWKQRQQLATSQALYETHKATTYPRSDCGYLPDSMLDEVPRVLRALTAAAPSLGALLEEVDPFRRSRAWNSNKITAHHGIIPTAVTLDLAQLSERERAVSEVATRIAGQLSGEGNSAAFREFAWRFVNIIARALIELGRRPDYLRIQRHVVNIDALFIEYAQHFFARHDPQAWEAIVQIEGRLNEKNIPRHMVGREKRVVAIEQYLTAKRIFDPVMDGLRSAVRYDRTYFDKIVASLLPLLEKLTSGKTAQLLAPNYTDLDDPRPIFDWLQIIRKRGIVYVGLDALSDAEVASAVGNSMFADLVSVAGHIYKHGIDHGLPGSSSAADKVPINLHADEFNELMGDEFIPLINKGGGAGIQVTAYTQTLSDIEARIGNRAKAGQVIGNFNTLQMLRVRETATAELLTNQLPKVNVQTRTLVSGATDTADPDARTDFTSSSQDRVTTTVVPLIEPAHIIALPKGQMFSFQEGGQLWKVRMPLPKPASDDAMPADLQALAARMRESYNANAGCWWCSAGGAPTVDFDPAMSPPGRRHS